MPWALSLRARLTAIILLPLLFVALIVGLWELNTARRTATEVFDRSLLSAALAVANDVAISGGDALSPRTRDILADTSGGEVFYHVYAPDGVIVAGYATPPVGIPRAQAELSGPSYFEARYFGRDVHGARLLTTAQVDGFAGIFTTTVWQDASVRAAFVRDLVQRSLVTICGLFASLALIVWFGVRVGLRPLNALENAIAQRNSEELSPIKRAVPIEVRGLVQTLNRLFGQVSRSMTAQAEFISNAAHQLKNPIAGVLSLAEAVDAAPTADEARKRARDLLEAARETADLSQKLLLLERAKELSPVSAVSRFSIKDALTEWVDAFRSNLPEGVSLTLDVTENTNTVECDPLMLREAIRNLLDNALRHGGPALTQIDVSAEALNDRINLTVSDNGVGLSEAQIGSAKERFQPLASTSGSGLGVSIVAAVAEGHGGVLHLSHNDPGLRAELRLPIQR